MRRILIMMVVHPIKELLLQHLLGIEVITMLLIGWKGNMLLIGRTGIMFLRGWRGNMLRTGWRENMLLIALKGNMLLRGWRGNMLLIGLKGVEGGVGIWWGGNMDQGTLACLN